MNEDTSQTGQQGYGSDQDPTRPQGNRQSTQERHDAQSAERNDGDKGTGTTRSSGNSTGDAGAVSTGQAAYGNSGETDPYKQEQHGQNQSRNSPSFGQDSDIGQSGGQSASQSAPNPSQSGAGVSDQGMPLGTAGGGYSGSAETARPSQAANQENDAIGQMDVGSVFAEQGQGALIKDSMGSGDTSGITDIDPERSPGRHTDPEGGGL